MNINNMLENHHVNYAILLLPCQFQDLSQPHSKGVRLSGSPGSPLRKLFNRNCSHCSQHLTQRLHVSVQWITWVTFEERVVVTLSQSIKWKLLQSLDFTTGAANAVERVLGKLGPGQLGPGHLGPGARLSGAQLSA